MIITFSHPKGGVGKTTLVFNYAIYHLLKGNEFTFIDLDGQKSVTYLNKLRDKQGLETLDIITFSNYRDLGKFLEKNANKNIIIDTGGFDSDNNKTAILYSDIIITPVSDSPIELIRLITFKKNILKDMEKKIHKEIKPYVILNRIHSSVKNIEPQIDKLKEIGFNTFKTIVRDRARIKFSLENGSSIFEDKHNNTKAQDEIKSFIKEVENLKNKIKG